VRYGFSLVRNNNEAWVVRSLGPSVKKHHPLQCTFAFPLLAETYASAVEKSGARLSARPPSEWQAQPHVEWILETTLYRPGQRFGLFVRPDRPGLVRGLREYTPDDPARWSSEYVIEYEESRELWPAVKSVTRYETSKRTGSLPWRESKWVVSEYSKTTPEEREFTVSYYGLPEPKTIPEDLPRSLGSEPEWAPPPEVRRSWLWLWLLIAGGVLLIGAICALRYRVVTRRRAAEAPQLGHHI
jgi:hypothetical protein